MSDSYALVRRGLRDVLQAWPEWRDAPLVLLRNRLLDECGGDARPYIALVIRAAELAVPERIEEWKNSGVPWSALRSSLVVSLVSEAFLQPEMAGWVVDTWGVALVGEAGVGVVETRDASGDSGAPSARSTEESSGTNSAERPSRAVATRGFVVRGNTHHQPPSGGAAPSAWAPPPPPVRRAPLPAPARPTPRTTARVPIHPPDWMNAVTRGALAVIVAGVLFLVVQVLGAGRTSESRRTAAGAANERRAAGVVPPPVPPAVREASASGAAADATPMSGIARSAMPAEANDPSRLLMVRPPTRERGRVGPGAEVLETQVATLATSKADRVELRSGRTITGRVEVVRASVILFRDAESGLRYEIAKQDIREITTEFGTKVRFGAEGDPQNERRAPLVARGLGGSYRVTYTFRDVRGSPECQSSAAQNIAPDVMLIDHRPGADTITFDIVNGSHYYGVVDADGVFATALALQPDQANESSAYTSRFNGTFTATGFDATFVLIAYRRSRVGRDITCQTTLNAIGEREGLSPRSPTAKPR